MHWTSDWALHPPSLLSSSSFLWFLLNHYCLPIKSSHPYSSFPLKVELGASPLCVHGFRNSSSHWVAVGWMVTIPTHLPKIHSTQNLIVWCYLIKRVFANVIKLRILWGNHPGIPKLVLNPITNVLKGDKRGEDAQRRPHEGTGRDWS